MPKSSGSISKLARVFDGSGEAGASSSRAKPWNDRFRSDPQDPQGDPIGEYQSLRPSDPSRSIDARPLQTPRSKSPPAQDWTKEFNAMEWISKAGHPGSQAASIGTEKADTYSVGKGKARIGSEESIPAQQWVGEFAEMRVDPASRPVKHPAAADGDKTIQVAESLEQENDHRTEAALYFAENLDLLYDFDVDPKKKSFFSRMDEVFGGKNENPSSVAHLSPEKIVDIVKRFDINGFVEAANHASEEGDIFGDGNARDAYEQIISIFCSLAASLLEEGEAGSKAAGEIIVDIFSQKDTFDQLGFETCGCIFDYPMDVACKIQKVNPEHSKIAFEKLSACINSYKQYDLGISYDSKNIGYKIHRYKKQELLKFPNTFRRQRIEEIMDDLPFYDESKDSENSFMKIANTDAISVRYNCLAKVLPLVEEMDDIDKKILRKTAKKMLEELNKMQAVDYPHFYNLIFDTLLKQKTRTYKL